MSYVFFSNDCEVGHDVFNHLVMSLLTGYTCMVCLQVCSSFALFFLLLLLMYYGSRFRLSEVELARVDLN